MELFSELYGLYYRLTADILRKAPLSRQQIQSLVAESGFAESTLQLLPKLLDERAWPLLEEKDGLWHSRLQTPPALPLTHLERRFLRAVLLDPRARLFLSDDRLALLESQLSDVKALYTPETFRYFDRYSDGDPFTDEAYRRTFRQLLEALETGTARSVTYRSKQPDSRGHSFDYLPLKLEYSAKDDKFRLHGVRLQNGRPSRSHTLNLARVLDVQPAVCPLDAPVSLEQWLPDPHAPEPLVVSVSNERNAIERFHFEFSAYEKQSVYDEATGTCLVTITYPAADETELLIRLLGFGPVLKVESPPHLVAQIRDRLRRQQALLPDSQKAASQRDDR